MKVDDFINSKLPITNADTVRFNGDTETIKDKYYRRLRELNETTKKGVSELSEMIEDVEFKEDIEETITTK